MAPMKLLGRCVQAFALTAFLSVAVAQQNDYRLGPGDAIHIQVFQNPDLSLDTRVSENGSITFPLIGIVAVGGLALSAAEAQIAKQLADGGYVVRPQVTVALTQNRSNQVSVIGQVNRPGRIPLDTTNTRLSEVIAAAGGIAATGADTAVLSGLRDGKEFQQEVDLTVFLKNRASDDPVLAPGDVVFVPKAPVFYIYGEVQHPGAYRLERNMTLRQALAQGGGLTPRGTERGMRIQRRIQQGGTTEISPKPGDPVLAEDIIQVSESLF